MLIAYGVTAVGLAMGGNLAPLWTLFASAPAALYLLVLLILAHFVTRAEA